MAVNSLTPPPARGIPTAAVPADGWTAENQGRRPDARRLLGCWAAAPVAAVVTAHAATAAGTGMVPALSAATATGAALIVFGARTAARADAGVRAARDHVLPAAAQDVPAPGAAPQRPQTTTRRSA